ncbi:PIR Superfamily Protein, partial [Plasmodium malariae]
MSGVLQVHKLNCDLYIENFIQSLPSNRYYRQNNELKDNYCSWFEEKSEFSGTRSKLSNYVKVKNVADKLTRALCSVAFTNKGDECKEKCHNLYYWLGNELLLSDIEEKSFSDVIGILENFSNVLYESGKCKCTFFKNVTKENFAKMKIVYDYCKDYEEIEKTLELHKKTCDSKFNDYIVKANSAYNEIYNCTEKYSDTYCMQLKTHVPSCFVKKLSALKCTINDLTADEQGSSYYDTTHIDQEYVINPSAFSSSQIFLFFVLPFIGIFFIGFLLYK